MKKKTKIILIVLAIIVVVALMIGGAILYREMMKPEILGPGDFPMPRFILASSGMLGM